MSKKHHKYYASQSSITSNQKSTRYKQKPLPQLKSKTKYIPLIPQDALYRQTLFHLTSKEFQIALQKTLKDLNSLLYFSENDFFSQLQTQDSLSTCLQSCLVCLGKNAYYNVSSFKLQYKNKQKLQFHNDYFLYYEKLHYLVLLIYHRIVNAQKLQHKQAIYDLWLLDVPKMIDFVMTFCLYDEEKQQYINLQIVKDIVSKAITTNPTDYTRDFDDFINILYQDKLPLLHRDIQLVMNFSNQAMEGARINFANPLRSFLISANKILFEVRDLFLLCKYVYLCFPEVFGEKLATDHQVLEDMLKCFVQFGESIKLWKLAGYEEKFQVNFQSIYQASCQCFRENFRVVKRIIQKGDMLTNANFSRAINSYSVHCMYFTSQKVDKSYQKSYETMIKTLIYKLEAKSQQLFFLPDAPQNLKFIKLRQEEKVAMRKSYLRVREIETEIQSVKENKEVEKRISKSIDEFFKKANKPQPQNRLNRMGKMEFKGKLKIPLASSIKQQKEKEIQKPESQQKQTDISMDFSLILSPQEQINHQKQQQDIDLSFEALKSHKSSSSSQSEASISQLLAALTTETEKLLEHEPVPAELCGQLEQQENRMQKLSFRKSPNLVYQDEQDDLCVQKQLYYHHVKPEFGEFLDRLIEREEWKPKQRKLDLNE